MTATLAELIGGAGLGAARAAAKQAGAHAFVLELPQGYDTLVGDGALPLSPSHRSRLELAHRLVADPAITGPAVVRPSPGPPEDRDLPGLRPLLDVEVVTPILSRALRSDVDVRIRSVRYKPGKNLVVHYDVGVRPGWREAVAYATCDPGALEAKAAARQRTYEGELGAVLQWLPLDLRLPGLADSGAAWARRLAEAGLSPDGLPANGDQPVVLRYWARRRAVLGYGDHIIKLYRDPSDFAAAERGLRAASGLAGVPCAPFQAVLPALPATVQGRVRGGRAPRLTPSGGQPVGAFLARLHRTPLPPTAAVATSDSRDLLAKAGTRAQFLALLVPGLENDLRALLADLETHRPRGLPVVTSHGNFHAGQLLETGDGLVMIDVDRLCRAHPGYDLASYATHLTLGGNGPAEEMDVVATALASLVEGYGTGPEALGWFVATCLLRRAAVPFRYFDERWPDAAATLVCSARRALGMTPVES